MTIRSFLPSFTASPQIVIRFVIVAVCFMTADPTLNALIVGAIISAIGEFFRLWSAGYGYKLGALGGRGPYRYVRHPYFLGTMLLFAGIVVSGRNPYLFAAAVTGLTLVYRRNMRADEKQMALRLGPLYARYRDSVPAFLPQLMPVSLASATGNGWSTEGRESKEGEAPHQFSLRYALLTGKHRELDTLLLTIFAFGLLALATQLGQDRLVLFHVASACLVVVYLLLRFVYYAFHKKKNRSSELTHEFTHLHALS